MGHRERMQKRRQDPEWIARQKARHKKRYEENRGTAGRYKAGRHEEVTYAIQDAHRRVKIGRTINLDYRLELLQCGNADELVLLGVLQGDHEAELKARFKDQQVRGEWFHLTEEIIAAFSK